MRKSLLLPVIYSHPRISHINGEPTLQELGWISRSVREDQGRCGYLPNVTGAINHPFGGLLDTAVNL